MLDELKQLLNPQQEEALTRLLHRICVNRRLPSGEAALVYLLRLGLRRYQPQAEEELDLLKLIRSTDSFHVPASMRRRYTRALPQYKTPHLTRVRFVRCKDLRALNGAGCAETPLPYFIVCAEIPLPSNENGLSGLAEGQKLLEVARDLSERLDVDYDPLQALFWQFDVRPWAIGFQASSLRDAAPVLREYQQRLGAKWCYRITDGFLELYRLPGLQRMAVVDRFAVLEQEIEFSKAESWIHKRVRRSIRTFKKSELARLEVAWREPTSGPELCGS